MSLNLQPSQVLLSSFCLFWLIQQSDLCEHSYRILSLINHSSTLKVRTTSREYYWSPTASSKANRNQSKCHLTIRLLWLQPNSGVWRIQLGNTEGLFRNRPTCWGTVWKHSNIWLIVKIQNEVLTGKVPEIGAVGKLNKTWERSCSV